MASLPKRRFTALKEMDPRRGVKVVTYNVFADKLATDGRSAHVPGEVLDWKVRGPRLLSEILSYSSDILCLQEVELDMFEREWRKPLEAEGYEAVLFGSGRPEDGCALVYNADKFTLEEEFSGAFSELVPEEEGGELLEKARSSPEGAVAARLSCRCCGGCLVAACTRLHQDYKWPDLKAYQTSLLCQAVSKLAGSDTAAVPVVIGGDLNSLWRKHYSDECDKFYQGVYGRRLETYQTSGVYELLSSGELPANHAHHPAARRSDSDPEGPAATTPSLTTHGLNLSSVHSAKGGPGREPPLTKRTPRFAGCVDYIFVSPHCMVTGLLDMPFDASLPDAKDRAGSNVDFGPLPADGFPSDHLAVGCELSVCYTAHRHPSFSN